MKMVQPYEIHKFKTDEVSLVNDLVVVEEPLEIKILFNEAPFEVALNVTMRTPGNDQELAIGFLLNEQLIQSVNEIEKMTYCAETDELNTLKIWLNDASWFLSHYQPKKFVTSSACGVCGKTSIEELNNKNCAVISQKVTLSAYTIQSFQKVMDDSQLAFSITGGIHAVGLFDLSGEMIAVKEDVGRHNAMDKIVGWAHQNQVSLKDKVAVFSGRISFELVQKAVVQQIPVIVAFGAPSSLAIDLCKAFNITVCGFAKNGRFNVYNGIENIELNQSK